MATPHLHPRTVGRAESVLRERTWLVAVENRGLAQRRLAEGDPEGQPRHHRVQPDGGLHADAQPRIDVLHVPTVCAGPAHADQLLERPAAFRRAPAEAGTNTVNLWA